MLKLIVRVILGVVMSSMPVTAQAVATIQNQEMPQRPERVSVSFENTPLTEAIWIISKRSGRNILFAGDLLPEKKIIFKASNVTTMDALSAVLKGTGIQATQTLDGRITLVRGKYNQVKHAQGVIAGKVSDAKTGKGIAGATVAIANRDVVTSEDGGYRFTGISAGTHTLIVRLVGYAKQTRTVTVSDGATVTADFKLEPSANVLDQVVVTGTVASTELRAVPNAMTVITAKQIEDRGITRIDQLFRGDIPGLFAQNQGSSSPLDEVTMFSRGATALSINSVGGVAGSPTGALSNPIKTYVDGVEMADARYLSQIDPKSIERIEILTGPQASTIYGSNAINGVMQIFTKRGITSKPQITASLLSGWVQNNLGNSTTPQHDYSAQLSGIEGRLSYSSGGSWVYMGPWTPSKQTTRLNAFGGMRMEMPTRYGSLTVDMSIRRTNTRNKQRGDQNQGFIGYWETGYYNPLNTTVTGVSAPTTNTYKGNTLAFTTSYSPFNWWTHELGVGNDASESETVWQERRYLDFTDTTLFISSSTTFRRSVRYSTVAHVTVTPSIQGTITLGGDGWKNVTTSTTVRPQILTGSLTGTTSLSRQPGHNTGGFMQTQFGFGERLFLTYGLRAEWNPEYGDEALPNYAPRYGLAYTQEMGSVTTKLRLSYGRSTRPPATRLKTAFTAMEQGGTLLNDILNGWGNYDVRLANPDLAPEFQQGGEGGIELYFGTRGALVITRYNQTIDGLIASAIADSARSIIPNPVISGLNCAQLIAAGSTRCTSQDADGYGYVGQSQNMNIGSIRNQGWELQGRWNLGPIATNGTYSWTKSRSLGITPEYRRFFTSVQCPQCQPGAIFQFLPEHTWAMGVTYAQAYTRIALNVTGTGQLVSAVDEFNTQYLSGTIRLPQYRYRLSSTGYVSRNSGYALADLTATQRVSKRVEGLLQVQNVTDSYTNDYDARYAVIGRQTKIGLRLQLQ